MRSVLINAIIKSTNRNSCRRRRRWLIRNPRIDKQTGGQTGEQEDYSGDDVISFLSTTSAGNKVISSSNNSLATHVYYWDCELCQINMHIPPYLSIDCGVEITTRHQFICLDWHFSVRIDTLLVDWRRWTGFSGRTASYSERHQSLRCADFLFNKK